MLNLLDMLVLLVTSQTQAARNKMAALKDKSAIFTI